MSIKNDWYIYIGSVWLDIDITKCQWLFFLSEKIYWKTDVLSVVDILPYRFAMIFHNYSGKLPRKINSFCIFGIYTYIYIYLYRITSNFSYAFHILDKVDYIIIYRYTICTNN